MITQNEKQKLVWSAPEYAHKKKSADWFWALGIISISLAITAFIFKNILFAILIILGAFTLAMFSERKPRQITFEIDKNGIYIGDEEYKWESIESFNIIEKPSGNILILKSEKIFTPYISVPLGEMPPEKIYAFLSEIVPEKEHNEPIIQSLMERFEL